MAGEANTQVPALEPIRKKKKANSLVGLSTKWLHILLLPTVLITFVYSYVPMIGVIIAFQEYDVSLGISSFWESRWVGFENFIRVFTDEDFGRALRNTILIANTRIVIGFFIPIIFALLLNEVRRALFKRTIQTIIYLPHFLSWVVMAGIIKELLSTDGLVNNVLGQLFHTESYAFLGDVRLFVPLLITTAIWKEFGFNTIVYLAAITNVDPNLYEAAMADGATRWKQTWHVTLPAMKPIIVLTAVLALGGVLNAGFDQIYNLYSVPVYPVADVIDTVIFRRGFQGGEYSFGAAFGLFNSLIGLVLISTSYYLSKKLAGYEIF